MLYHVKKFNAVTCLILGLLTMAVTQARDKSCVQVPHSSSLQCRQVSLTTNGVTTICDISIDSLRLVVSSTCRRLVFDALHGLSNPKSAAGLRLVAARYFWQPMNKDVRM